MSLVFTELSIHHAMSLTGTGVKIISENEIILITDGRTVASAQSHRQAASPHTRGPSRCGEGRLAVHVGTRKSLLRRATQAGNGPFLPETTVGARFQFTACCDHRGTQECGAVQGVKFVQGAAKEEV